MVLKSFWYLNQCLVEIIKAEQFQCFYFELLQEVKFYLKHKIMKLYLNVESKIELA